MWISSFIRECSIPPINMSGYLAKSEVTPISYTAEAKLCTSAWIWHLIAGAMADFAHRTFHFKHLHYSWEVEVCFVLFLNSFLFYFKWTEFTLFIFPSDDQDFTSFLTRMNSPILNIKTFMNGARKVNSSTFSRRGWHRMKFPLLIKPRWSTHTANRYFTKLYYASLGFTPLEDF